jgi:uncharacterized protein (DUF1015 family)
MNNYKQKFASLGIEIPSVLLPKNALGADMQKWPVIACDQYTQDREYWEKARETTAGSPSTLNLIFPEVFLSDADAEERIKNIHSTMERYLKEGIFGEPKQGFIYIERDTPYFKKRRGLLAAIDLEQYEWKPQARPLIRSTEGTVQERLPPRMNIRRGAPLELPHVLLLIDDDKDSLLPALAERIKSNSPVYNTPLMMDSGNASGWLVNAQNDLSFVAEKFEELHDRSVSRYPGKQPFLFAVGDGNHSLAAAKGIWEEHKKTNSSLLIPNSSFSPPCRYALVEIENIYDPAIQFEPIHRVVFGAGYDEIISILSQLPSFSCRSVKDADELVALCKKPSAANCFGIISQGRYALIETSASGIATACLQPLLDKALEKSPEKFTEIDYIHDDDEVLRIAAGNGRAAGILLPPVQKSGLFETVARTGPLPRKSFSMGHSCEKRFYLECRSLL